MDSADTPGKLGLWEVRARCALGMVPGLYPYPGPPWGKDKEIP